MSQIFCALSNDPTLTAFPVDFDLSLTVGELKDAIRATRIDDLGHLDADKLTLVRIGRLTVGFLTKQGGLTKKELEQSKESLNLKAYSEDPEYGDDTVSRFRATPGRGLEKDGLFYKVKLFTLHTSTVS
jgi:hypothetical protein